MQILYLWLIFLFPSIMFWTASCLNLRQGSSADSISAFSQFCSLNSQIIITVFLFIHHTYLSSLWIIIIIIIIIANFLSSMHHYFILIISVKSCNSDFRVQISHLAASVFQDQLSLFFTCGLLQFVLFFTSMFSWCRIELFHPKLVDIVWWLSLEYTHTRWIKPHQYWRLYWWCKSYIYGDLRIIKIFVYFRLVLHANHQSSILRLILCAFQ
jgi:hypothetical protein